MSLERPPRSQFDCETTWFRFLAPLLLMVVLSGCARAGSAEVDAPGLLGFDRSELLLSDDLTTDERETILMGSLLGGPASEITAIRCDGSDQCRVRIYGSLGGTWSLAVDAPLDPELEFVDLATINGEERLLLFGEDRFSWFDPARETAIPLVEVELPFTRSPEDHGVPRVDITRDVNGDGRDDLIVPRFEGFWISLQESDGTFAPPLALGPPEPLLAERSLDGGGTYREQGLTSATIPWYLSRVHEMDYDQDGRSDLVFWNRDHFVVHHQNEGGSFSPRALTLSPGVPFDRDGPYTLGFGFADVGMWRLMSGLRKKSSRTVLHLVGDLNGDGVADLVTHSLTGRSPFRQRSRYEIHHGRAAGGESTWGSAEGAHAAIVPRGRAGGMQPWGYSVQRFKDIDGDGELDALFGDVKVGFGGMARAMFRKSVAIDVAAYRSRDGRYPESPSFELEIRPRRSTEKGGVFFPAVLLGDVSGDGRADLLVGNGPRELLVYVGEPTPRLFSQSPRAVAVELPDDERRVWLHDINQDGKQDVVIHYRQQAASRLTFLMAR